MRQWTIHICPECGNIREDAPEIDRPYACNGWSTGPGITDEDGASHRALNMERIDVQEAA